MGINIPANSSLGIEFFSIISFFFVLANMNLTVFAGILLAVTMVTARRASLGEKTKQAAGKADEPDEAIREAARPAKLVEKIMRAAAEAEEPDEAKRESAMTTTTTTTTTCSNKYCNVATNGPSDECCDGKRCTQLFSYGDSTDHLFRQCSRWG